MTSARGSTLLRVLGNSAWLMATESVARLASLLTTLYLARTLAADGVGLVESGLALFMVLQIVSSGGVEALFTREAARRPHDVPRLAGVAVVVAWIQFVTGLLVLAVGTVLAGPRDALPAMGALFATAAFVAPLGMRFAHVAAERAPIVGVGVCLGYLAYLGSCLVAVRGPEDAMRVGWCWIAGLVVRTSVLFGVFLRRHGPPIVQLRGLGGWLRRTATVGIGSGARGLQLSIDILVLGLVAAPVEVARYALAAKLPLFLASFATFLYIALFPTLARAVAAGERARLAAMQATALDAVLGVAVTGAVALGSVAEPIVVLLFSERFRVAAPLLAILLWRVPLLAAGGALRTVLWAHDPARDARVATTVLVVTLTGLPVAAWHGAAPTAWWMLATDGLAVLLYAGAAETPILAMFPGAMVGRLAGGLGLAAGLVALVPRDAPALGAVAAALGAWAVAALVADLPHVRRLAHEIGMGRGRRDP